MPARDRVQSEQGETLVPSDTTPPAGPPAQPGDPPTRSVRLKPNIADTPADRRAALVAAGFKFSATGGPVGTVVSRHDPATDEYIVEQFENGLTDPATYMAQFHRPAPPTPQPAPRGPNEDAVAPAPSLKGE